MRPQKRPKLFRHDEGNVRGLEAQEEWKISLIMRQRLAGLEKKVGDLEERLDGVVNNVNENTVFLLSRLKVIRDALTPEVQVPTTPPDRVVILKDNTKERSSSKKRK